MVKILIVEDDRIVAATMARHLSIGGHKPEVASSCQAALEMLEGQDWSLILVDHELPDGNGLELTSWIRSRSDLSMLPVVMCTSSEDDDLLRESFAVGVTDFLRKPIRPLELTLRVSSAIRAYEASLGLLKTRLLYSKADVVSLVAHEINNPLAAAYHVVDELAASYGDCPETSARIRMLNKVLDRIRSLVTDLRTVALSQERAPQKVRLAELVRLICRMLAVKCCGKVWVRHKVDPDLEVWCHPGEVSQSLSTVCGHMLDYIIRLESGGLFLSGSSVDGEIILDAKLLRASSCGLCDLASNCNGCAFAVEGFYNPNGLGPQPPDVTLALRQLAEAGLIVDIDRAAFPLPRMSVHFGQPLGEDTLEQPPEEVVALHPTVISAVRG